MDEQQTETAVADEIREFIFGDCPICVRERLTHLSIDSAGAMVRRCVHCDAVIASELRVGNDEDLTDQGYEEVVESGGCGSCKK